MRTLVVTMMLLNIITTLTIFTQAKDLAWPKSGQSLGYIVFRPKCLPDCKRHHCDSVLHIGTTYYSCLKRCIRVCS